MTAQLSGLLDSARRPRVAFAVVGLGTASIAVATLVVGGLEQAAAIPNASAVYLVAVAVVGSVGGTLPAVGTAIASFLAYNLLFTEPRFSLVVADPTEWLNLVLFLVVAIAVGRLAALGRERAAEADRRAEEATHLFDVSRLLATADSTEEAAGRIVRMLAADASLERVWIELDGNPRDHILADTSPGPTPSPPVVTTLVRAHGEQPARWLRAHDRVQRRGLPPRGTTEGAVIRVRIETGGSVIGSLWGAEPRGASTPNPEATRILSLAADQIGLAVRRDRLRQEATSVEITRRGDALKSALLDSVSHDLRTPLASIRATAGNLADADMAWSPNAVREAAGAIDLEVQRLDRLVTSVLDLSRIESGELVPELEVYDVPELVEAALARFRPLLGDRPVTVELPDGLPFVRVDAVLLDSALANLLENVARHTPSDAPLVIRAGRHGANELGLTIEDGGPGVADADLPRLFDKFYRVSGPGEGSRRGMGIGLSVVRGMVEAMGGKASAARSALGGLAVELALPVAQGPPVEARLP